MNVIESLDIIQERIIELEAINQASVDFFNALDNDNEHALESTIFSEDVSLQLQNLRELTFGDTGKIAYVTERMSDVVQSRNTKQG